MAAPTSAPKALRARPGRPVQGVRAMRCREDQRVGNAAAAPDCGSGGSHRQSRFISGWECSGFTGEQVDLLELPSVGGLGFANHPGHLDQPGVA